MKPEVVVHFNSTIAHSSQIFTGLEILKADGKINLNYELALAEIPFNKLRVSYKGKRVIFDMADDSFVDEELLKSSDFYVKRMLLKSDFMESGKLFPFGLNYSVMAPNPFFKSVWKKDLRLYNYAVKYHPTISKLLAVNDSISSVNLGNMECCPNESGKIIFVTRLWDPQKNEETFKKDERKRLNIQRIAIIRTLKNQYGDEFIGGIEKNLLSNILCPDLIVSKSRSSKVSYLNSLKEGIIGISNFGLEGSIGWKFAEYISHGMAIVSTPIDQYMVHGELLENQNFLKFETLEECLSAIDLLKRDTALRKNIQVHNIRYYNEFLHPRKKMEAIFSQIDGR